MKLSKTIKSCFFSLMGPMRKKEKDGNKNEV